MTDSTLHILATSRDPDELLSATARLVRSPRPEDHAALLRFLSQSGFLGRLDSAADYEGGVKYLRISRAIRAMRDSKKDGVRQVLAGLAEKPEFLGNDTRVELLIWASAVVRPPTEGLVRFWDAYCRPEDCFNGLTMRALTENGTEPAIALLERKFTEPGFEDDDRTWWMRTAVFTHRNDPLLLAACHRLLQGDLADELRQPLVEVLFDDRQSEWHGPDGAYPPPPFAAASEEARQLLATIGEAALALPDLPMPLTQLVKARIESIRSD